MSRVALIAALLAFTLPAFAQSRATAVPNPMQGNVPVAPGAPRMANPSPTLPANSASHFASESLAQAHCVGDSVVWVNLRSKAIHLKGTKFYGHTKSGAYMCQRDAVAGGMHAAHSKKPSSAVAGH